MFPAPQCRAVHLYRCVDFRNSLPLPRSDVPPSVFSRGIRNPAGVLRTQRQAVGKRDESGTATYTELRPRQNVIAIRKGKFQQFRGSLVGTIRGRSAISESQTMTSRTYPNRRTWVRAPPPMLDKRATGRPNPSQNWKATK